MRSAQRRTEQRGHAACVNESRYPAARPRRILVATRAIGLGTWTVEAIRGQADRIFINAAADNTFMPPGPDGPSPAEREQLADWLACGAP